MRTRNVNIRGFAWLSWSSGFRLNQFWIYNAKKFVWRKWFSWATIINQKVSIGLNTHTCLLIALQFDKTRRCIAAIAVAYITLLGYNQNITSVNLTPACHVSHMLSASQANSEQRKQHFSYNWILLEFIIVKNKCSLILYYFTKQS